MAQRNAPTTPKELAAQLKVDPKRLRAYLRREFPRDAQAKNSSWSLTAPMVNAARKQFTEAKTS